MKYFFALSIILTSFSLSSAWAVVRCDKRMPTDVAYSRYLADGHGNLGGYQIDFMENSDSLLYVVRVCRTDGSSKCGDPNKFGVTYRITYKYNTGSGVRCVESVTIVGN